MSIQDDVFDLTEILKDNKGATKMFKRFTTWAFEMEELYEVVCRDRKVLADAIRIVESRKQ